MIYHRLGKTPARPDAVKFKFRAYSDPTALPTPPLRFGNFKHVKTEWSVLGNDKYGCCVWSGASHEHMIWGSAAKKPVLFTDKTVLDDYAAATGFDPKRPDETDNGSDMQQAASYRRQIGILDSRGQRHKIDAYVAITPGDIDELMLATYLFGTIGCGIRFPETAMKQFDNQVPWDVVPSRIGGGHYINLCGRNSKGNILLVTWGRLHAATPSFIKTYCDEAICYLSRDILNEQLLSPEGFDFEALQKDLGAL